MTEEELRFVEGFKVGERYMRAGTDIIAENEHDQYIYTLYAGWAARYRTLDDGRKQILGILLPGDMVGLQAAIFHEALHAVQAITDVTLCVFQKERFVELFRKQPMLGFDVTWLAAHSEAIVESNLLTVGRRNAVERVAHFIVSLHDRLEALDLVSEKTMRFPLTQQQIADALGLSIVHTNKTLKRLGERQLISLHSRQLTVHDRATLVEIARYDDEVAKVRPMI